MTYTLNQKLQFGNQAISSYQNCMVRKYKDEWKYSIQSLIDVLSFDDKIFLEKLGDIVIDAGLGQRRLNEAMERVAENSSPKKLPTYYTFSKGITDELIEFDFSLFGDAALDVGKSIIEVGDKAGKAVSATIEGATDSISFFAKYLKFIIIGVGLFAGLLYYKIATK